MAVAPTQPAAGVTESGDFSQSDEDLASRGFSCHSTIDDLDLDQFISLLYKVRYNLFSTFPHLCRFSQPYLKSSAICGSHALHSTRTCQSQQQLSNFKL
jgi:hypothetical protein